MKKKFFSLNCRKKIIDGVYADDYECKRMLH